MGWKKGLAKFWMKEREPHLRRPSSSVVRALTYSVGNSALRPCSDWERSVTYLLKQFPVRKSHFDFPQNSNYMISSSYDNFWTAAYWLPCPPPSPTQFQAGHFHMLGLDISSYIYRSFHHLSLSCRWGYINLILTATTGLAIILPFPFC